MNFEDDSHILLRLGILESTEPSPKRANFDNAKNSPRKTKAPSPDGEKEQFVDVNIDGDVVGESEEETEFDKNGLLGSGSTKNVSRRINSESYACRLIILSLMYFALGCSFFAVCSPSFIKDDGFCHFTFCLGVFGGIFLASVCIRKVYWVFLTLFAFVILTITLWALNSFTEARFISFFLHGLSHGIISYCGFAVWYSLWKRYFRYVLFLSLMFSIGFVLPQILFFNFEFNLFNAVASVGGFSNSYSSTEGPAHTNINGSWSKLLENPSIKHYLIGSPVASFALAICILTICVKIIGLLLCCLQLKLTIDKRMEKLFDESVKMLSADTRWRFMVFQIISGITEGVVIMLGSSHGENHLLLISIFFVLSKIVATIIGFKSCSVLALWLLLIVNMLSGLLLLVFSVTPILLIPISISSSLLSLCCTLNIEKRVVPRPFPFITNYLSANSFGNLLAAMFCTYLETTGRIVLIVILSFSLIGVHLFLNRLVTKAERLREILQYTSESFNDTYGDYLALTENISDAEMDDLDLDIT